MAQLWSHIKNRWNNLSLAQKVIFPQSMLIGVLLLCAIPLLYNMSYFDMMSSTAQSGYTYASYAVSNIETKLRQMRSITNYLASSSAVQQFLGTEDGAANPEEQWINIQNTIIFSEQNRSFISSINLYAMDGSSEVAKACLEVWEEDKAPEILLISDISNANQWRFELVDDEPCLKLTRRVLYQGREVGMLCITAQTSLLSDMAVTFSAIIPSHYVLLTEQNHVVYHSQNITEERLAQCLSYAAGSEGYQLSHHGTIVYIVNFSELRMKIVAVQTPQGLPSMSSSIVRMTLVIVGLLLLCILLTIPLYLSISRRIRRLAGHMANIHTLTPLVLAPVEGRDEIAGLTVSYNELLLRLEKLAQETQNAKMLQQVAAYEALQAQIKPHFLYNTLETLRMLAEENDDEEVADMIYQLGRLLRNSITPSRSVPTLQQEVESVENYLALYRLRMPWLSYEISLEPATRDIRCPRFTIQPLVENAIKHGLKNRHKPGCIWITSRLDGEFLYVDVADNGVGIPDEQLDQLNEDIRHGTPNSDTSAISSGLGLHNVHTRLQMFFSDRSSVSFVKSDEPGIICQMKIDYLHRNQQEEEV